MTVHVFGVPVVIEFVSLALFIFVCIDAMLYISKREKGLSRLQYTVAGVIVAILAIASIMLHELGHAIMATMLGDQVVGGGISWWGAYVKTNVPLSQLSPLNEIVIAFAGPAMNYIIAFGAAFIVLLFGESLTENTVQYLSHINFVLGRLNLYPVLFLDGGKIADGVVRIFVQDPGTVFVVDVIITAVFFLYLFTRGKKRHLEDALDGL